MEMSKKPVFTVAMVNKYYNNAGSARSAVKRLLARGKAYKIRNNLYTCVSAEHGGSVANRFQIASAITPSAFISHHTAMEYYGITNQMFYEVYVSSETRFQDFAFDGYTYRFVRAGITEGVEIPEFSGGIRVTDREQTLIDCMKDMDRIAGIGELLENIGGLAYLNEEKLLRYLSLYDVCFLYQKAGFLLSHYRDTLGLSDAFFQACRGRIGNSRRYLTRDSVSSVVYDNQWQLVVPAGLFGQEGREDVTDAAV